MQLRGLTAGALFTLMSCSAMSAELHAQDSTSSPKRMCWRGRAKPACDMFLLTQVDFFRNIVRPSATFTTTYMYDSVPQSYTYTVHQSDWKFSTEVGGMVNRGKSNALGATLLLDASPDGVNVGVKGRYRRWLTPEGIALDLGAGIRTAKDDAPSDYTYGGQYGGQSLRGTNNIAFTGDVAINAMDYAAIVGRVDVEKYGRKMQPTVSLGVRAESRPAVFALAGIGVTYAALLTIVLIAFRDGFD